MPRRLRLTGIFLLAALTAMSLVAAPAQAKPRTDATWVTSSETFSGDSLVLADGGELSGLKEVRQPWYVVRLDNKKTAFVWGAGAKKAVSSTSRKPGSKINTEAATAAAATCSLLVDKVYYGSDKLRSNTLVTCSSPGGISTEALFQRRNSILVWVRYGGTTRTGTIVGSQQNTAWNQVCNSGDNKLWLYRLRARGYTSVAGTSAWYNGASASFYCGT
jgi:hypothetical protein